MLSVLPDPDVSLLPSPLVSPASSLEDPLLLTPDVSLSPEADELPWAVPLCFFCLWISI